MARLIDLTGKTFGRLRVIERAGTWRPTKYSVKSAPVWRCLCDPALGGCGRETAVLGHHLRSGGTRSCGCLRSESLASRSKREEDKTK